jgi:hypothetical protein
MGEVYLAQDTKLTQSCTGRFCLPMSLLIRTDDALFRKQRLLPR